MGQIGVFVAPLAIYEHPRAPIELRVAVAAEEFMLVVEIAPLRPWRLWVG